MTKVAKILNGLLTINTDKIDNIRMIAKVLYHKRYDIIGIRSGYNTYGEIERRNIKVKLRGQIRADKVTYSILYNLKRTGFFSFACGIENESQRALTRMNKKAIVEDNKKILELFKKVLLEVK